VMARFVALVDAARSDDDLTAMGAQPVHQGNGCTLGLWPDTRAWVEAGPYCVDALTAIGEATLVNRSELLHRLAAAGEDIDPLASDGTILLATYAQWGTAGLAQADGMFALAIWDGTSLTLVRDPVGARTLFYTRAGQAWATASHLRPLRHWPALQARLNLAAVRNFLTFAYLPGVETLLEGVYELLPGQWVRLHSDGRRASGFYWFPQEQTPVPDAPPEHYTGELRRRLEQITAAMLPANEDVGVLLSGGVDSSLVTALAARLHSRRPLTYSINFGEHLPNELAYSGLVASHCRTRHRVLTFSGKQIADSLAETVALLDCPVGDPLTVPNLLLARAAAADGLRVILNGEGGDPCFGGPKNLPMLVYELQRECDDPVARAETYLRSYRKCYELLPQILTVEAQHALRDAPPLERLVQPYLDAPQMHSYLNRLLLTNVRTKGAHHILTKVERITSSCGLEGRAPLFSRALVEYSFAIPPQLKLAGDVEKWALKQAVADLLPPQIIERPKSGMRVPVQHWLRGPLRDLAGDLLLGRRARERGIIRQAPIREWLRGEGMLWPRQGITLWILLTLELWVRSYVD
jgi:asparagine synthase (glutamine-hydrolysing)